MTIDETLPEYTSSIETAMVTFKKSIPKKKKSSTVIFNLFVASDDVAYNGDIGVEHKFTAEGILKYGASFVDDDDDVNILSITASASSSGSVLSKQELCRKSWDRNFVAPELERKVAIKVKSDMGCLDITHSTKASSISEDREYLLAICAYASHVNLYQSGSCPSHISMNQPTKSSRSKLAYNSITLNGLDNRLEILEFLVLAASASERRLGPCAIMLFYQGDPGEMETATVGTYNFIPGGWIMQKVANIKSTHIDYLEAQIFRKEMRRQYWRRIFRFFNRDGGKSYGNF